MGKKKKINPIHSSFIISVIIVIIVIIIFKKIFWKKDEKVKTHIKDDVLISDKDNLKKDKKKKEISHQILTPAPNTKKKNISKYINGI